MKTVPIAASADVFASCTLQGKFPADDRFRARENFVRTSGQRTGFINQQRKGE